MKKSIILLVILIGSLASMVNAANVGIVVEFPDNSVKTDCVSVSDSASGYDLLQQSAFDIAWSDPGLYGRALCKIDDVGDEVSAFAGNCVWDPDLFWAFYILDESSWAIAPLSAASYNAVDKDVIGFVRSGFDFLFNPTEEPPVKTYSQVCENLEVKDIKVYVDGKKESGADEDGGKIDVIPGSKLELKIEIENSYNNDDDVNIEDINVVGTLEGIDDGDDLEDDVDEFDVNAGKDKKVSLKFSIPLEVEEDSYDLTVTIEGENKRGFSYSEEIEFEVEVEKEKHDVVFNKLEFSNDNVECSSSASLDVKVVNLGTEEEEVNLVISNQELGIDIQESFILSEDPFDKENSFAKTYKIILPSVIGQGIYTLRANLFYGNDVESENAELNVVCEGNVLKLEGKNEEIKEAINAENVQITSQPIKTGITGAAVSNPAVKEKKISNGNILMISVIAGEVIILIAGISLLVILLRR
jgi:hypothetical protein